MFGFNEGDICRVTKINHVDIEAGVKVGDLVQVITNGQIPICRYISKSPFNGMDVFPFANEQLEFVENKKVEIGAKIKDKCVVVGLDIMDYLIGVAELGDVVEVVNYHEDKNVIIGKFLNKNHRAYVHDEKGEYPFNPGQLKLL